MRKTLRYFLFFLIAMYANLQVHANEFSVGNWKYELTDVDGAVALTGFKKESPVMEIPASINYAGKNYDVISVKCSAFHRCFTLNKIIVGSNVKMIEQGAFNYCPSLKEVTLPSTLDAFSPRTFLECDSIENYYTTGETGRLYAVDGILYSRDLKSLYAYPCSRVKEEVVIPDGVEIIESSVFSYSKVIQKVLFPSTLKEIGYKAFYSCKVLEQIELPQSLERIDSYAFNYCEKLDSVVLPESLYSLGYAVFSACTNLKNIEIKGTLTSVEPYAFQCTAIDSIILKANIDVIPRCLFSDCRNLKKVDLPDSLLRIEECAFNGCSSLENIVISDCVHTIADNAFAYCKSLTNFDFPSNLRELGPNAFFQCTNLTQLNLKNTKLRHVKKSSFEGCQKLEQVKLPDSLFTVGDNAFASCGKLDSIIIPNLVISIGAYAFASDSSLTYIEVPSSVTNLGPCLFQNCFSLKSFDIPTSWTCLPYAAFLGCKSLSNIEFHKNISEIGEYCFANCENLKEIDLPVGIRKIPEGCFSNCSKLESITFGLAKPLTHGFFDYEDGSVDQLAFENCTSLREIHFLDIKSPYMYVWGNELVPLAFKNVDCKQITAYVPSDCLIDYEQQLFGKYIEEENPKSIFFKTQGYICTKYPLDSTAVTIIGSPVPFSGQVSFPKELFYADQKLSVTGLVLAPSLGRFENLTSIHFPSTFNRILGDDNSWCFPEFNSFYWCHDLKQITVDENNEYYFSHRGCLYSKKTSALLHIPFMLTENDTIVRHYSIPEGVKKLVSMNDWFAEGPLRSLSIPSSVDVISVDFFSNALVDTVYIFAKVPPVANYEGYSWLREGDGVRGMNILYVPYGCKSAYEAISEGHINIVEMPNAEPTKVRVKNYIREYGDSNPVFEYELLEGELDGIPNITCIATEESPAGEYEIVINKGTETNTNVSYENGVLTVVKAPLKVSVGSYEREQGFDNPQFLIEYEGWKLDDDVSVLEVQPSVFTDATKDSPCGIYPIIVSGGKSDKYEFKYVDGELHVIVPAGIEELLEINSNFDVYSLDGRKIAENVTDLRNLSKGVYIINGRKVVVK